MSHSISSQNTGKVSVPAGVLETPIFAAIVGNRIGVVSLDPQTVESYVDTFNQHCRADVVPAFAIAGQLDAQDPAVESFACEEYWVVDEAGIVVFRSESRAEAVEFASAFEQDCHVKAVGRLMR